MPTINQNELYSFRKYFDQKVDAIDLAAYFGYRYRKQRLNLPRYQGALTAQDIIDSINRILPQVVSSNEQTKREMLVSPVMRRVLELTSALLRIEYSIKVTDQLQGTVDYLLSLDNLSQLVVIKAKNDDLDYGFTQLFAELIALDQWERSPTVQEQPMLIGAVTTGSLWQFGTLERLDKRLTQGLNAYQVPDDLDDVLRILLHPFKPLVNQQNEGGPTDA